MDNAFVNHVSKRKEQAAEAIKENAMKLKIAGVLFIMGLIVSPVEAANFSTLATLITDMGEIFDAVITIIPSIITIMAYFAAGGFIVALFTVILGKMEFTKM